MSEILYYRCPGCGTVNAGGAQEGETLTCVSGCVGVELEPMTAEQLDRYHGLVRQNDGLRAALADLLNEHSVGCNVCRGVFPDGTRIPEGMECRTRVYRGLLEPVA